jgi:cyclopropane fatty-acyl-phospholipid synthase-like methyltransferase
MFVKFKDYDPDIVRAGMMGPNPMMLAEELICGMDLRPGMTVLDLGCGKALSSIFLAKEYGVTVYAVDPSVNTYENSETVKKMGLEGIIYPIFGDAMTLPFKDVFDVVICINAYHNFGAGHGYFSRAIAPKMKSGAQFGLAIPGLSAEYYGSLAEDKKAFYDSCAMPAFITAAKWREIICESDGVEIISCAEMTCTNDAWTDWIRAASPMPDSGDFVSRMDPKAVFIAITGRKKRD